MSSSQPLITTESLGLRSITLCLAAFIAALGRLWLAAGSLTRGDRQQAGMLAADLWYAPSKHAGRWPCIDWALVPMLPADGMTPAWQSTPLVSLGRVFPTPLTIVGLVDRADNPSMAAAE